MKVIKYGENNIAFGLQWMRLPGERISSEIAAALEERNTTLGIVRKISDEYDLRQQIGMCEDKSAKGSYSAATLLAGSEDSVIFIDKVSDEAYWVCAIADKEILPGGDFVGPVDTVREKLEDLLGEFGPESDDLKIVASAIASEELEVEVDVTFSFEDFVFKNEELFTKESKIGSIKSFPKPAMYLIGIMLLGGAAYLGLNPKNERVEALSYVLPGDTPFQAIERVNLPLGPSEDDILSAALMEEIKWLREEFELYKPESVIDSVMAVAREIPRYSGGWTAKDVKFDAKVRVGSLSVVWSKGLIGGTKTLIDGIDDIQGHRFSDDGQSGFTLHAIEMKGRRKVGRDILQYISRTEYGVTDLMDHLQNLNVAWSIRDPSISVRPVPIEGIKSKNLATKRQLNQRYKEFKANDTSILTLTALKNKLAKADTVLIKTVIINAQTDSWQIVGEIYEK